MVFFSSFVVRKTDVDLKLLCSSRRNQIHQVQSDFRRERILQMEFERFVFKVTVPLDGVAK
ncbi:hypothetical protein Hlac_3353 (plasmid) [Halorubrum lacusprofundi ATCC 49239]|uniref:Uncharacterized protein n=1 Tax=Halorubrum lacusprofundi (strain ATCC 49239 / DSM 5036 / JCM 8891 / ACAM 34) TaxID=416348 RepID=B9LWN2_HALLT|nr:hypothetical protein Hlac_3353 [Halorubrum lacusprofundi ATCC 49239]